MAWLVNYLLLIATLFLVPQVDCVVAGFRTKTGRMLSGDDMHRYFPSRSVSEISSRLFEVTRNGRLIGQDVDIDLRKVAGPARPVEVPRHASLVVDGLKARPDSGGARMRKGALFTVAENARGDVLAVWGSHTVLRPVDSKAHPGLFFSSAHDSAVDLHDDIATWNSSDYPHAADVQGYPAMNAGMMPCEASGAPNRDVQVAIAFDSDYCAQHGGSASDAEAAIRTLIAAASEPFSSPSCLRLIASHIDAYCDKSSDPYISLKGSDAASILEGFRSMWTSDKMDLVRDIAFYVSGYEDGTSTAGRAYVGAACSNRVGFGWAEGDSPYIFAHELGHSLGADHDSDGLMSAVLGPGTEMKFSSASMRSIMKFVDDPNRAACITESGSSTSPESTKAPAMSPSPQPSMSSQPSAEPSSSPIQSFSLAASMTPSSSAKESMSPMMMMSAAPSVIASPLPIDSSSPIPSTIPDPSKSAMASMSMTVPPVEGTKMPNQEPSPSTMMMTPEVIPTTEVEPTPSASYAGTCYAGNGSQSMFGCTRFADVGHVVTMTGSAHVRVRQMASHFDIRLNVVNESDVMLRLTEIHVRLTMDRKNLETSIVRRLTIPEGGSHVATVSIPAADVPAPAEQDSCCNEPLYIYTAVTIRRTMKMGSITSEVESVGGGFFESKVLCEKVCDGRKGSAVLSLNGCPICEEL